MADPQRPTATNPSYSDVARLIRGDDENYQDLPGKLARCAAMIIAARRDEAAQPTFEDIRDYADRVIGAATLLVELFAGENTRDIGRAELHFLYHMYRGDLGELDSRRQNLIAEDLRDVVNRARRVKQRLPLEAWRSQKGMEPNDGSFLQGDMRRNHV
jgi:hypothetical protein